MPVRKKENLWQLLERLDNEAGQFNQSLYEANRYFDIASRKTMTILQKQEQQLHDTIGKLKKAVSVFRKKEQNEKKKNENRSTGE